MTIEEIKTQLAKMDQLSFVLPDGNFVPAHFHITEVGKLTKDFIDCGGKRRTEESACFQLWQKEAEDNHRLAPQKLIKIIEGSQAQLGLGNLPIVVEYQGANAISKFGLEYDGKNFLLTSTLTACLAEDECGIPETSNMIDLSSETAKNACTPGGGCC